MQTYEIANLIKSASLVLCIAAATYLGTEYIKSENHRIDIQTMMMLMQGGVPGTLARCLAEEADPRDVAKCHAESHPANQKPKGREL